MCTLTILLFFSPACVGLSACFLNGLYIQMVSHRHSIVAAVIEYKDLGSSKSHVLAGNDTSQ